MALRVRRRNLRHSVTPLMVRQNHDSVEFVTNNAHIARLGASNDISVPRGGKNSSLAPGQDLLYILHDTVSQVCLRGPRFSSATP